jgi:hypothetical protein
MASPPKPPPLEDPLHEKEIFVSEIAGIAFVHGNFVLTLASFRPQEPVGDQPPQMHRVVVGRIALTNAAAGQLLQHLKQMAAQIEAASSSAKVKPN